VVVRGRRARSEAAKDLEWLRWIGRFRFVDAEVLSGRFGVSVAAVNGRLRKLEQAGLVVLDASVPGVPRVVHVAGE
jgi:hypothetical protein